MRCNNCGWENPDSNQTCEKCNAPLKGGARIQNQGTLDSDATTPVWGSQSGGYGSYVHETLREDGPFSPKQPTKTINDATIPDDFPPHNQPDPIPTPEPTPEPTTDFTGTINPYAGMGGGYTPIQHCILKPFIFPGEDIRDVPKPINLKGNYNELNRQILDPDNNTITSKVQALLTNKDGKWYIQDQSVQKTTFVYAGEPVALKSGDIILMGNRTFVFEED